MRKELVAFLGVSGKEKDGRVQFAVYDSNFHHELLLNNNYKEVEYTSNARSGKLQIFEEINPEDLLIEVFRAPNQGVNENSRGVRITHKPSGLHVVKMDGHTLYENKKEVLKELEEKIYEGRVKSRTD